MLEPRHGLRRTNRRKPDFTLAGISHEDAPEEVVRKVACAFTNGGADAVRRVHVCNALVRIASRLRARIAIDDLFCSLVPGFFHDGREVRAAVLRCTRKLLTDEAAVASFFKFHLDYLVARCLDLGALDEEQAAPVQQSERLQALKVVQALMGFGARRVGGSLLQPLLSICRHVGRDGERRDQLWRAALLLLAELCVLTPGTAAEAGALQALLQSALDTQLPARCTEAVVAGVAHLLNSSACRWGLATLQESLQCLASPLTNAGLHADSDGRHSWYALLAAYRTWPGQLCLRPHSLLAMLRASGHAGRLRLLQFLFRLFLLPEPPAGCQQLAEALASLDAGADRLEEWSLAEGFVAAEGCDLLDYGSSTRPNLLDNHLAYLLQLFVHCGLLESLGTALVSAMESGDAEVSVRSALLLGELLHRSRLLPAALPVSASLCVPALVDESKEAGQQAVLWLTCVQRRRERRRRAHSVQLAALLEQGQQQQQQQRQSLWQPDDVVVVGVGGLQAAVAASRVRQHRQQPDKWAWPKMLGVVRRVLQHLDGSGAPAEASNGASRTDDQVCQDFLRCLSGFYSPKCDAGVVSQPASWQHANDCQLAGVELMRALCQDSADLRRLLLSLLADACDYIRSSLMHSPTQLLSTCSGQLFALLGALTASDRGEEALEASGAKQLLLELVAEDAHPYLPKLLLSSLDYTRASGFARLLLAKALSSGDEETRLYATRLTLVLMRCRVANFPAWGIELLVKQLYDPVHSVRLAALAALEEACELEANKSILVRLRPAALHLGDQGAVLIAKLCGFSLGFSILQESNWFQQHFELWRTKLCRQYSLLVEQLLAEALTGYERPPEGQDFVRASSRPRPTPLDVLLPTHLFGQLALHKDGFDFLRSQPCLREAVDRVLLAADGRQFDDTQALKSALWCLGHTGSTSWGVALLEAEQLVPAMAKLADSSPELCVRAACFWCLGLVASTEPGCQLLSQSGWEGLRTNRGQLYPVVLPDSDAGRSELGRTQSDVTCWQSSQDSVYSGASSCVSEQSTRPHSLSAASATVEQQRKARSSSASECGGQQVQQEQQQQQQQRTTSSSSSVSIQPEIRRQSDSSLKSSAAALSAHRHAAGVVYLGLALPDHPARISVCSCDSSSSSSSTTTTTTTQPAGSETTSGYASRSGSGPRLLAPTTAGLQLHSPDACIACRVAGHRGREEVVGQFDQLAEARAELLRLAGLLTCQVNAGKNEAELVRLKARHPRLFASDLCLYSELSLLLASYPFSRRARTFLQELFNEAEFDALLLPAALPVARESDDNGTGGVCD